MKHTYRKVRFTSKRNGPTAGLVIEDSKWSDMSVSDISRLFPYGEAGKMQRLETSSAYESWEEAFNHDFDCGQLADIFDSGY
jgi:hypothetical protein